MSSRSLLDIQWRPPAGVRAAFTTRLDGASSAPWNTFNLGAHVGDSPTAVAANRGQLQQLLALKSEPRWLSQVHGIEVANLDESVTASPPTADAAIASVAEVACAVMVADCLPVLFASRDGQRIGAAHAGWRGLASGVLERTVAAMDIRGEDLSAWLGPAISRAHFEVGADVREAFVAPDGAADAFFEPNARGRWQADLVGLARRRLERLGIQDISGGHWCTFADRERFFSHRRDGKGGRMAAVIWREC